MENSFRYTVTDGSIILGYKHWITGSQNRHLHDHYEILYVVSGKRDMFVGDRTVHMSPGDLLLIPPNVVHKSFNNFEGSEIYSLYINREIEEIIKTPFSTSTKELSNVITKISSEFKDKKICYEEVIKALSMELIISISREHLEKESTKNRWDCKNPKVKSILKYINENYSEAVNLKNLSEKFIISEGHLSRSFSKETGFSLTDYITHVRIQKSKELLQDRSNPISSICFECGFGSITNFGRSFKKLTGHSPKDYRKNL